MPQLSPMSWTILILLSVNMMLLYQTWNLPKTNQKNKKMMTIKKKWSW